MSAALRAVRVVIAGAASPPNDAERPMGSSAGVTCLQQPAFVWYARTVARRRAEPESVNSGSGCGDEQSYFESIPVVVDWWGVLLECRLAIRLSRRSALLDHRECRLMNSMTVFEEMAFALSFATISTVALNSIIHLLVSMLSIPV
jgi:hypothetical protein